MKNRRKELTLAGLLPLISAALGGVRLGFMNIDARLAKMNLIIKHFFVTPGAPTGRFPAISSSPGGQSRRRDGSDLFSGWPRLSRLLAALAATGLLVQVSLAATFTDNFTDPSNWGTPINSPGKGLHIGSGRMNFTATSKTSGGAGIPRTKLPALLPTTKDWSMQVEVHVDALPYTGRGQQFTDVFLGFGKTGGQAWFLDSNVTFEFDQGWSSRQDAWDIGDDVQINGATMRPALFRERELPSPDAALRMDYSAANHTVTYLFDADGAAGGYDWVSKGTADLASGPFNLSLSPTDTFTIFLAGSSSNRIVNAGQAYLANLVIVVDQSPVVGTGTATALTATSATLKGTVNPNGLATTAQFEYGLTTNYGATVSVALSPSNSPKAQAVSATLNGLQPGMTYHFRLTATNSDGVGLGSDATLATLADVAKPTLAITTPTANQRISNAVFTARGKVTDNAGVSNVWYRLNGAPDWLPATDVVPGRTSLWSAPVVLEQRTNRFEAWAEDGAGNRSVTQRVNFVYVKSGLLLVATVGQGTINPNYRDTVLEIGLGKTIKAAGLNGHQFRRWEVATNWLNPVVVTNATLNFVMQSNLTLTAVFADTSRPVITLASLKANQRISNAVFTVRGKVTDNAGVSNVWYRLNGAPDWLPATDVVAGRTSLWSAPLVLEQPANKFEVWAEDAAGNRSPTNSVTFTYVKLFTLSDYFPLPLGASWLYDGTDWDGSPAKVSWEVTSTNFVITNYTGHSPVVGYTTNSVRIAKAYVDRDTLFAYDTWEDFMACGGRVGFLGGDDLPDESIRAAGGLVAPVQMAVGSSATPTADVFNFGKYVGSGSITFQLLEHTNLTVPAGHFPDVLHLRLKFVIPGSVQVHDEWWARSVGGIKRSGISGDGSKVSYELIRYSLPSAQLLVAQTAAPLLSRAPRLPLQFECGQADRAVGNGSLRVRLSGPPGTIVVVEGSPDLLHWLPVQTNTLTSDRMFFSDPQGANFTRRFYRLRSP
jgi:hypothetical protein